MKKVVTRCTKEIGIAQESVDISQTGIDAFGLLSRADVIEDESIIFYKNLANQFPQWSTVINDIIEEELKHKGQLQALRESLSREDAAYIEEGEQEAGHQLEEVNLPQDDELTQWLGADTVARMNGDFGATDEYGEDSGTGVLFVESQQRLPSSSFDEDDEADEINRLLG